MMEEGYDVIEMPLPGVISVVKEINTPRMASLKGKMRSKSAHISTLNANALSVHIDRLGLKGSPTQVLRSFVPEKKAGGEKASGNVDELAAKIKTTILELEIIK